MTEQAAKLRTMAGQFESDAATSARYAIDAIPQGWGDSVIKGWAENAAHLGNRALDLREAADALESFAELLAICKEALPLVEEYLQGIPEFADKMRAAIERAERVSRL